MMDTHNTILHLKQEATLFKIYGIQKKVTSISIFLDDREGFCDKMESIINENKNVHEN